MEASYESSVLQEFSILNSLHPLVYKYPLVGRSEKSFLVPSPFLTLKDTPYLPTTLKQDVILP